MFYGTFHTFTLAIKYIIPYWLHAISSLALSRWLTSFKYLFMLKLAMQMMRPDENKRINSSNFECWKITTDLNLVKSTINDNVFKPLIATRHKFFFFFNGVLSRYLPCSETPSSCDIRSLKKLNEVENTSLLGLPMPYISSLTSSQFSQRSLQAGAPLAPRTGFEQPYWHRPCYFGWHYVTRG